MATPGDETDASTGSGANTERTGGNGQPPPSGAPLSRTRLVIAVARIAVTALALVILYVAAPVDTRTTVEAVVIMAAAGAVFAVVFTHHVRALQHSPYPILRAANLLATTLTVFILGFSLTYLTLAEANPSAFSEPLGKMSAVYFTVTVLATVGFGDITATTDATRAIVTLQMLSGITLLGVLVRYVVGLASNRARSIRDGD